MPPEYLDNDHIHVQYQKAGGPERSAEREEDESIPTSHVLMLCLGVVAAVAVALLYFG